MISSSITSQKGFTGLYLCIGQSTKVGAALDEKLRNLDLSILRGVPGMTAEPTRKTDHIRVTTELEFTDSTQQSATVLFRILERRPIPRQIKLNR